MSPVESRSARKPEQLTLASRAMHPVSTIVDCSGIRFGGEGVVLIAGPCSVEGRPMLLQTAAAARAAGAAMLRGGAFKPRSSPYTFQGLGEEGLRYLADARAETGLPIVTEVMSPEQVELVAAYADMLQIGARNMQNFSLLQEVGRQRKPVMLKRGMMASISEWLGAAEYILAYGNDQIVLCERGIRTFETHTRFTLDLSAVPAAKALTHLPVIVDPSHATGLRELVIPMAAAAVAAGADGIIVEAHPHPETALCDGPQSLQLPQLGELAAQIAAVAAAAAGRTLHPPLEQALPAPAAAATRVPAAAGGP